MPPEEMNGRWFEDPRFSYIPAPQYCGMDMEGFNWEATPQERETLARHDSEMDQWLYQQSDLPWTVEELFIVVNYWGF